MRSMSTNNENNPTRTYDTPRWFQTRKRLAIVLSLLMIGATVSPIVENWREKPQDNFPLSYYPMFTKKRSEKQRITHIVGLNPQSERHMISYKYAGTGGLNQVRKQIAETVRNGHAAHLCQAVASRIADAKGTRWQEVMTIRIVTGSYRLADYFSGNKMPASEAIHATCAVERRKT
jgi:hypothetical protein